MTAIFKDLHAWREFRQSDALKNQSVGVVTTMGNLHHGHANLISRSVLENDFTVVTIFVNPTQFDCKEDYENYSKTLDADLALLKSLGVDAALLPTYEALYPYDYRYCVSEKVVSRELCGSHRDGHFDGMLTVVMKLLLVTKADRTYFGEKDFQQLQLVTGMCEAFFLDTKVVPCQTVREQDGLAMSSRNSRLMPDQRKMAKEFSQLLASDDACDIIISKLVQLGFKVDYILDRDDRRYGAVRLGDVRLIDNVLLSAINADE